MKHILIIDDDITIGSLLEEALTKDGYTVTRAYSGTEALLLLDKAQPTPDLILLDLMLPGLPGEEVLPKIEGIPTIILSAKVDVDNKVNLLLDGAADYITKPFNIKELLARITVQLRMNTLRKSQPNPGISPAPLTYDDLTLTPDNHTVTVAGTEVRLTRTEYAILKLLMQNPAQVITKTLLLDRIAADTPDCTESSLKTHISHLRAKLRRVNDRDYIESVWGIGFKLKEK